MQVIRRMLDAWRAWRRGERRTAPYPVRGRVYEKRDGSDRERGGEGGGVQMPSAAEPQPVVRARVRRADGTVEDLGVIGTATITRM